jgi:urease accessory protein
MTIVSAPLLTPDLSLPEVRIRGDRHKLAKRLWRGVAEDGTEFGFELASPVRDGDVVHQTLAARYVIKQEPEPVLEVSLSVAPSAAAGIGWAVGNLHLELMAETTRLLTPDDTAARQLLDRLKVPYVTTTAVFRPGRFVRGNGREQVPPQELGRSHQH